MPSRPLDNEQLAHQESILAAAVASAMRRQWRQIAALATAVAGTGAIVYAIALPSILSTAREKWLEDDAKSEKAISEKAALNYANLSARLDEVRAQQTRHSAVLDRLLEKVK